MDRFAYRCVVLLVVHLLGCATVASPPVVTLVESVPVETTWDTAAPEARDVWPAMFDQAKERIDIAQFYFAHKEGRALQPTLDSLRRAARRGVHVRILAEKAMVEESGEILKSLGAQENIDVAWFDISEKTGGIIHAKYFIVDGTEVFVGSQNFDWRALEHIHELGVRVRDASVAAAFERVFEADWQAMTSGEWTHQEPHPDRDGDGLPDVSDPDPERALCGPRPDAGYTVLCPVFAPPRLTPPGLRHSLDALLQLLANARRTIDIQVMTYDLRGKDDAPWTLLDEALRKAAERGVRIRFNISDWNATSPRIDYVKALQRVPGIEVRMNAIPAWSGGYLPYARVDHSKYMVIDGTVGWVGTSNWGWNYFESVRAAEIYFTDPTVVAQLQAIFDKGWSGPYTQPLDPDREYEPRKHD